MTSVTTVIAWIVIALLLAAAAYEGFRVWKRQARPRDHFLTPRSILVILGAIGAFVVLFLTGTAAKVSIGGVAAVCVIAAEVAAYGQASTYSLGTYELRLSDDVKVTVGPVEQTRRRLKARCLVSVRAWGGRGTGTLEVLAEQQVVGQVAIGAGATGRFEDVTTVPLQWVAKSDVFDMRARLTVGGKTTSSSPVTVALHW
jgi:hypothetical protein